MTQSARADVAVPDAELSARFAEALAHHQAGRLGEALRWYDRILLEKPDWAQIHSNRGLALARLGRLDAAVEAYQQAIVLDPEHAETLSNCGVVLAELNRFAEAEQNFRRAIALKPAFAGAYNNLGLILKEQGRFAEALQATMEAIRLAPKNTSYYASLAAIRSFEPGDPYVTALETMADDTAALSNEDRVHLHFTLGKAYEHIGKLDSSFEHLLTGNALKRGQIT